MNNSASEHDFVTPESEKLNLSTKLAYGAGDLGSAITANILVFYLSFFLTDVAGMGAALAGSVRMVSGIWDAINDPIVGVLSDRTRSRWGRRYPWMIFGAVPLGIFFFLHWIVPPFLTNSSTGNNQWGLFWYYIIIGVFFNTAFTAVNLPYTALTPELTKDYNERTSLNSFRFAFSIGGSILSLVLAQIIFSTIKDKSQQYLVLGGICALLCILPSYICIWGTRKRVATVKQQNPEEDNSTSLPYLEQLRIAFTNRAFLFVIGIYLCSWLAVQTTATIIPYFVVNWMGLKPEVSAQVALGVQGTALLMLFPWTALSKRLGKKAVYFMGMSLWLIAQIGLFFLQPGQIGLMYFLAVLAGFGVSTAYLIPWSMIPDVIELDELNTGQRREGIFYGFMVLLQKIGLAIGLFIVGLALEAAKFIPGQQVQPDSALFAIRVAIGPFPTVAVIGGLILAYFYPLTREVHAEIMLKLHERRSQKM